MCEELLVNRIQGLRNIGIYDEEFINIIETMLAWNMDKRPTFK